MAKLTQSYAHGVSMTPLIGETIGVHFDQAAERWSSRDALDRAPAKRPLELWRAESQNRRVRRRAAGARARAGRPDRHLVAEQLRMGDHAIRDGEGRSHPRQHQPRVSPVRARIRAQQSGLQGAGHGRFVQVQRAMSACCASSRRRSSAPLPADCRRSGCPRWPRSSASARATPAASCVSTTCSAWAATATAPRSPSSPASCNSTTRSTSSSPAAPPARPRARR